MPTTAADATRTGLCDCSADGYCPRYRRPMAGRFRQLCQGINVDLGTAAAFREQWAREASDDPGFTVTTPKPLLLKTGQAPGDAVAMTAAIHSLHRAHPGKYLTSVESYWPDVFAFNPDVASHRIPPPDGANGQAKDGVADVQMHYPAVHQCNERGIHFMQGWCEFFGAALGVNIPLLTNRPRLYFPNPAPPVEDFWLVCSGGKRDFTNKLWGQHNYQEVVKRLKGLVRFVQVGGARPVVPWNPSCHGSQGDEHPPLDGVVNMVGKTSLRELFDLTRRARGVLCGVSLLMHVAAALEKPAVVIAGGREPVPWNAYPLQQYVHTVGALPCRDTQGRLGGACWRTRVVPLKDGTMLDNDLCERPVNGSPTSLTVQTIPECMKLIRPSEVAGLILRYNRDS